MNEEPQAGTSIDPSDPRLHWDGQQWLWWDGAAWVTAVSAGFDLAPPASPGDAEPGPFRQRRDDALERAERRAFDEQLKAERKAAQDEEKASRKLAATAAKQEKQQAQQQQRAAQSADRELREYLASPPGMARTAFERGDEVFQYSIDVMRQQAVIVSMVGSTTSKKVSDPVAILNAVCREGWALVNGSFVFIEEGQQSRDKFLSSGQNVAIKGTVMGYYLFRRHPENRHVEVPREERPTRPGVVPAADYRPPEGSDES